MKIAIGFTLCDSGRDAEHSAGEGLLFSMLFSFLGIENPEIKREHNGKPFCSGAVFSVSHSSGAVMCAVAADKMPSVKPEGYALNMIETEKENIISLGADTEILNPQNAEKYRRIALSRFSKRENSELEGLDDEAFAEEFLKLWTQKESYGKMTGRGLMDIRTDMKSLSTDEWLYTGSICIGEKKYIYSVCAK